MESQVAASVTELPRSAKFRKKVRLHEINGHRACVVENPSRPQAAVITRDYPRVSPPLSWLLRLRARPLGVQWPVAPAQRLPGGSLSLRGAGPGPPLQAASRLDRGWRAVGSLSRTGNPTSQALENGYRGSGCYKCGAADSTGVADH